MNKLYRIIGLSVAIAAVPSARVFAQTEVAPSTTQPTASGARVRGPSMVVERLRAAVAKLDLTADQKAMIDPIFEQATADAQSLAEQLQDEDLQNRLPKVMAFGKSVRDKVEAELSEDQKQALETNLKIPTTRPAGGLGAGGFGAAGRYQQFLTQLDLTADQQAEIKDILEQNRQKMAQIRQSAAGIDAQTQVQQLRQETRQKLGQVLQPEQLAKLQELLQQNRPNRKISGQNAQTAKPDDTTADEKPIATENKPADLDSTGPDVGAPVPSVKLTEINGRVFDPAAYKGHVIVLEFGSLSCPTFRDQAPSIEKLKNSETGRAFFVLVYTREAFPQGKTNVERNQKEGCDVPQATTLDERQAEAANAVGRLDITLPVAIDTMDDTVAKAYGLAPNGSVVIGKDGMIASRQKWTNADSLRRAIDDANGNPVAGG